MSSNTDQLAASTLQGANRRKFRLETLLENIATTVKTLNIITRASDGLAKWAKGAFRPVREALYPFMSSPEKYHMMDGDERPDDDVNNSGKDCPNLSPDIVVRIANLQNDIPDELILQVVSKPLMAFEKNESTQSNSSNLIHYTHARLSDGSGDQIKARMSMELAYDGKRLHEGDVIMLTRFTPITFAYSSSGSTNAQRTPAIIVHSFTRVGHTHVSDTLNPPKHCEAAVDSSTCALTPNPEVETMTDGSEFEELVEVDCTPENRYCSLYGVNMATCICNFDPVEDVNLQELRQYCWFATKEVDKMANTHKRNMLYWWYMTNTYNICGKGNRLDPPACLKAAIRKAHPEANGKYKIFVPGGQSNKRQKR